MAYAQELSHIACLPLKNYIDKQLFSSNILKNVYK